MIPLSKIESAREAIAGKALRTPLVRLNIPETRRNIYLKLENLQPIGSFKRGAGSPPESRVALLSARRACASTVSRSKQPHP